VNRGSQGFCLVGKNSQNGLFAHHLTSWKAAFCADIKVAPGCREIRVLKDEVKQFKREIARKDHALAEAAALLILQIQMPSNRLSVLERKKVLTVASSDEFGSLPPSQIVPILADRGEYIASESTFYRILRDENLLRHRGAKRPAQRRHKPHALCATAPNQLFCWDYPPTVTKGIYFYLYLFMDIFSRKIVGWQIYESESAELAGDVMRDICAREAIKADQVVLHSDNGHPMKGATMLATLQAPGVSLSFSRPAASNDNPFSEALFKSLKY